MGVQLLAGPLSEDLQFQGESFVLAQQDKKLALSDETFGWGPICTRSYPQTYKRSKTVCQEEYGVTPAVCDLTILQSMKTLYGQWAVCNPGEIYQVWNKYVLWNLDIR